MTSFCTFISFLDCHFGTKAQTNTLIVSCSLHHKGFLSQAIYSDSPWIPIFSFTAYGALKLLHRCEGNVCFPSQEASASGLKVNHGGLGQIFSSLENSLHMTHFRYPQILTEGSSSWRPSPSWTWALCETCRCDCSSCRNPESGPLHRWVAVYGRARGSLPVCPVPSQHSAERWTAAPPLVGPVAERLGPPEETQSHSTEPWQCWPPL